MKYIGISGFMGAGKSTVADMMKCELGCAEVLAMAKPIKDIAGIMGWNGKKDEKGRRLLQLIGTECGRECLYDNVWVDMWFRTVNAWPCHVRYAICDDIRFDNEAAGIIKAGGFIVLVTGRGELGRHKSEQGISEANVTFELDNKGSIYTLRSRVSALCEIISTGAGQKGGDAE